LKTQKAFNGAVAESNMRCMRQRQFRLEVTQKLKYAINMFDPGEQRDTYIERALERLYNELGDPTMGYTSPATRQDHNLLVDVAGYCNYCQQYLLGKRFAERALEIASHASIEGRRRLAEAQEGLGERREAIQTLKEASDISPHNPRVWSDLRELYRKEGQWGRFVQATMNYLNYERTLGSEETIALLLEMCEAQKAYMQLTADKAEPYKITRDELIIRGIGTRVLGEEYGPLRFTSTQRQGRILQLDEVERLRTYVMYSQALDAAQELIAARDLPHWHETERQLVDWIAALQEGRANARAMVPADFFPQPDLTHEARIRTFNGSLLVRDEDLEASQLIDDAGEPESVPNHCDHIRTIMKTNPPALPTLAQQGKLPDPQDIAPPQEAPPDPYIIGLYSKFEMGEGYDDDIVSSRARLFWEQAGQEDDITLRIEVVEALVGYRIEGKDVGLLPEGLQALIMHGGDYGDLQLQVSLLEESDDKRVTN
jgi:tetratricopeptide (TPR) repeat protein